ncbi:hypothetical protein PVK06_021377 [Gossypium arboreum]|uniref:RNase H type-1 domain-containing protein n=1 Tax=Gossypium arboreum TaxID=29729 RepID=A0ABR0PPV4_GOSAR|nr:hypothetical protein PVK06_021377 [Gossypium arboreum]
MEDGRWNLPERLEFVLLLKSSYGEHTMDYGNLGNIGARNVILELNSLEVVHMLLTPMSEFSHFAVARDVKRLIQNQWEVNIQHVKKEGKKVAYALARHALGWGIGFYSFLQPLDYVLNFTNDDLEGLTKLDLKNKVGIKRGRFQTRPHSLSS